MEFKKGDQIYAHTGGRARGGTYIEKGEREGEHWIDVEGERSKVINNEIELATWVE